jgi:hypothetical protein
MPEFYEYSKKSKRCSAFIACGNATKNGDVIMAHNTHAEFVIGNMMNVVMTIVPSSCQKIIMQTAAGYIASGSDWFICENGIVGCETTIGDINYKPNFGTPYYCRIREAMQYGKDLDDFVEIMRKDNAGDYACSWLLGDTRSHRQEIMLLEIAKKTWNVERKTDGIFYGMNSAISKKIRDNETNDEEYYKTKTTSGARNIRFHFLLYETYAGKLDVENAKTILSDHYDVFLDEETDGNSRTICKHNELDPEGGKGFAYYPFGATDGKVLNSEMARKMSFLGRMGPSCGHSFSAKEFLRKRPEYKKWENILQNMPNKPWTYLSISTIQ